MSIDDKASYLIDHTACIEDITMHTVSANWYRLMVDMTYECEEPVEIVEVTYNYDLNAWPAHLTVEEFKSKSTSELMDLLCI